ncbi:unnamed protein product [Cuscuta epithymum]|uniref:Uncharacterized protein n=1 Tax=Cuscuta epithymum TaxID=186058 RepID=A0AAV0D747_9ASTE|nr:unnamed protein product [Cuscuta epithymum]
MDDSGNVRLRQHGATTATWFHSGDVVRLRRSGANPFSGFSNLLEIKKEIFLVEAAKISNHGISV